MTRFTEGTKWRGRTLPPGIEALLVVGVFIGLTSIFTFPLVSLLGRSAVGLVDPMFNEWVLGWVSDRLRHGGVGLFDAPILYPYVHTLAYSEHLLGIAIFVAPIYWVTGNSLLTHNVALILSFVVAGAGMYLLARSLTGRRDAAMIAALAFAFCPYRRTQILIIQMLMSGWMPIAVWALRRYFQTGRRLMLGAFTAAFIVQSLTSVYFPFFLAIPVTVIVACELMRGSLKVRRASLQLALAAGLIFAALAPIALIYAKALRGQDAPARVADEVSYGADFASYGRVDPRIAVYAWAGTNAGSEGNLFPGATVLVLATVALWPGTSRRHPGQRTLRNTLLSTRAQFVYIGVIAFALSLGPQPSAFGYRLLTHGPFFWLASVVPGLAILRVPARFGMVVHFAIAALAAFGAARILERLRGPWVPVTALVLAAMVTAEGYGAPLELHRIPRAGSYDTREAWRWIQTQPPLPIVELPMEEMLDMSLPDHHVRDVQDGTLFHGRPVVNGSSRFTSEIQTLLGSQDSPLADRAQFHDAFALLQQLKVGYAIVHPSWYGDKAIANATLDYLFNSADQVAERRNFGDTLAFTLRPAPALPPVDRSHVVAATMYRLSSSHDAAHLAFLSDGDPLTGWSTSEPQQGREWISLEFSEVHDIAAVRLEMRASSLRAYPRRLEIESSRGGDDFIPVFSGSVLPQVGAAFLVNTRRIVIDLPLAPNQTRILRIRQVGQTTSWPWALQELSVSQHAGAE